MIKRIGTCALKEGVDPDEFWKYHTQEFAHTANKSKAICFEMQKYVIDRVIKTVSGEPPKFYDITYIWWDSEEGMNNRYALWRSLGDSPSFHGERYYSAVTDNRSYVVQEFVARNIDPQNTVDTKNKMIKRISTCSVKQNIDVDDFWRYHTYVHAPHILKASGPGLKKYVINRFVKLATGKLPDFYDFTEMWWESEEAMNKDYDVWKTTKLPDGTSLFDDYDKWVVDSSSFIVEEFVVDR